ncbi:MAG TPA: nitrous oxide reductase accessory protein NosL [Hanamia sp.]
MKKAYLALFVGLLSGLIACSTGPQPIKAGVEACDFCKMTISQENFGGEILTKKGKVFKFDDLHCLSAFRHEKMDSNDIKAIYFINFLAPHNFLEADKVSLLSSRNLHSPMGGNTAAFDSKEKLAETQQKVDGSEITMQQLYNNNK